MAIQTWQGVKVCFISPALDGRSAVNRDLLGRHKKEAFRSRLSSLLRGFSISREKICQLNQLQICSISETLIKNLLCGVCLMKGM